MNEACLPQKGQDGYDGGIYQRTHWYTWTDQDVIISGTWQELFKAVGFCNRVLNDLNNPRSDIFPENKKKLCIAEPRALRAFFCSMLVDMFGNVPIVEKVSELNPPTKARIEVFNYVGKETAKVKNQLLGSTDAGSYERSTREAALALLLRLYLNAKAYTGTSRPDDCTSVSQTLLQKGYQLESTRDVPFVWSSENSKENIWMIPNDEIIANGTSVLFYRSIRWSQRSQWDWKSPNRGWNGIYTIREFTETYDTTHDRRRRYDPQNGMYGQLIWGPQFDLSGNPILGTNEYAGRQLDFTLDLLDMVSSKEDAGACNTKHKVKVDAQGMRDDFASFRTAEINFNLAETILRKSNEVDSKVLEGINKIRIHAGVSMYTTGELVLGELYREKGREMCYEILRRTDMIRFGRFIQPMWDKNYTNKKTVNLFLTSLQATKLNPELKQDPGYTRQIVND